MAAKKQKRSLSKKDNGNSEVNKELEIEVQHSEAEVTTAPNESTPVSEAPNESESGKQTVTAADSVQNKCRGKRSVCAMHKVIVRKSRGKKFKVTCNEFGAPNGETRKKLQSYIGMLARTMIPIDIPSWPQVDSTLKSKIWIDIQVAYFIM